MATASQRLFNSGDGAGEGLLLELGPVEGLVKGTGVGLAAPFLLVP